MKKIIFPCVLAVLFLSSCSNLSLGYRFADNWMEWQIDDLFDLTSKQENFVEKRLDKLKRWHKSNELPAYVAFLKTLKEDIKKEKPVVVWAQDEIKAAQNRLVEYILPDSKTFLSGVSAKQWRHFQGYMLEKAQDRKKDKDSQTTMERWEEGLDQWIGKLTPAQKRFISQNLVKKPTNYDDLRYQHSILTAKAFQTAMNNGNDAFLNQWLLGQVDSQLAEFQAYRDQQAKSSEAILIYLVANLTSKQKKILDESLADLIESIEDI